MNYASGKEQLRREIKLFSYETIFDNMTEKIFLKIVNDYLLEYDKDIFDMHKPSDIRSLVYLFNRINGFSELQCEYNDEEMI